MLKRKLPALLLALLLMALSATALGETPLEDRTGRPIALPDTVETIVSLAPSITQVIVDVGLADKLAAVDIYSAGIEGLPEGIVTFDAMAPDMEWLISLSPDVILASAMVLGGGVDAFYTLEDMGMCIAYIPSSSSVADIIQDTLFIGQVVGKAEEAQALCDALLTAMEALKVETDAPLSVYFEIASQPALYSFGGDTFLDEMITLLGGQNIFHDQQGWLNVSDEQILAANPDIIFTNEDWNENAAADILARPGWEGVSAIANGQVYVVSADDSSQPNHRIIHALNAMAEAFAKAGE